MVHIPHLERIKAMTSQIKQWDIPNYWRIHHKPTRYNTIHPIWHAKTKYSQMANLNMEKNPPPWQPISFASPLSATTCSTYHASWGYYTSKAWYLHPKLNHYWCYNSCPRHQSHLNIWYNYIWPPHHLLAPIHQCCTHLPGHQTPQKCYQTFLALAPPDKLSAVDTLCQLLFHTPDALPALQIHQTHHTNISSKTHHHSLEPHLISSPSMMIMMMMPPSPIPPLTHYRTF